MKNGFRTSTIIASIALILSLLAIIIVIVMVHGAQVKLANLDTAISALTSTLTQSRGTFWNPVRSCRDIPPGSLSGDYWIQTNGISNPVQVYCDMNRTNCSCGTTGGWMRVANLDMTDPSQNCPVGFQLVNRTSPPLRTCGRPRTGLAGCASTTFRTYGMEYSNVCGRVIGYQYSSTGAFGDYGARGTIIESIYADGVSLTYGHSPWQHIWTFAGAIDETGTVRTSDYPCIQSDIPYTGMIPSFVGQDYFCDTGSRKAFQFGVFYADNPLWDGQGCGGTSTCCVLNNPPWFCKHLPQLTTDDIQLRICGDEDADDEDTPIEQVEIYIN